MQPICEMVLAGATSCPNPLIHVFSFITGYWIWNKILENLATLGYDPYVLPENQLKDVAHVTKRERAYSCIRLASFMCEPRGS